MKKHRLTANSFARKRKGRKPGGKPKKAAPKPVVPAGYEAWRSEVMLCINALVAAGAESQCMDLIDAAIPYELGWNPVRTARAILKLDEKDHWALRNREVKRVRTEAEVATMKRLQKVVREQEDARYQKLIEHIAGGGRGDLQPWMRPAPPKKTIHLGKG